MTRRTRLQETLNRLAAVEETSLDEEFLAPMLRGGTVCVRIAGVVCRLKVDPRDFESWGIFKPTSPTTARLVRAASLAERRRYLDLLPRVRLIVCARNDSHWLAVPAHRGDRRFRITGVVPVCLVDEAQLFEVVETRFDGARFWYEGLDERRDPGAAAYLREALGRMVAPEQLDRRGLTAEERAAYAWNYAPRLRAEEEAQRDRTEERLRAALAHAGATFREYQEQRGVYRVAYEVDGRRHVSVIGQRDLSVQVAGICLSGQDRHFDLQSLVSVLREAHDTGAVVPVGLENRGMDEDVYWDVHPPEP